MEHTCALLEEPGVIRLETEVKLRETTPLATEYCAGNESEVDCGPVTLEEGDYELRSGARSLSFSLPHEGPPLCLAQVD